jgi:TPR repeat protein
MEDSEYPGQNLAFALEFFKMAAEQRYTLSQYTLGKIYQLGIKTSKDEIKRDLKMAQYYFERAVRDYDGGLESRMPFLQSKQELSKL